MNEATPTPAVQTSGTKRKRLFKLTAFWRKDPFTSAETKLINAVLKAHRLSVFRDNVSSVNILQTFAASTRFENALISGIATLGGPHAPIEETMLFLNVGNPAEKVAAMLAVKQRVPGWGNSFYKGVPDELWKEVAEILAEDFPEQSAKLDAVTEAFAAAGKKIFPNPSAYTAATAQAIRMPAGLAVVLFIGGRLDGWAERVFKQFGGKVE